MPKVSVIIPCYKAKETIAKTLHSIAMQTIAEEIEVIIVNDCDGLDYHSIIDTARFGDLNIKYVVREKNGGCGAARNTGIKNATADYILFLDADDMLIHPLGLEAMYNEAIKSKADLVIAVFESEMRFADGVGVKKMVHSPTWCHGKLMKRQYILDNNLIFRENLRINEDVEFNQMFMDLGAKVAEIPMIVSLWRDNAKSVTHESFYKNKATFVQACGEYIKDCNERGYMNDRVIRRVLQNIVVIYQYYNVCCDECLDKVDDFMALCREYWKLCEPIVQDVEDELITKVYCAVMKDFQIIPSVGFIKFLDLIKSE